MVTYLQFYKAVKSYYYRQSLLEKIGQIETKIIEFLKEKEMFEVKVPGYFITIDNGKPSIKEIPYVSLNQLEIKFKRNEENKI